VACSFIPTETAAREVLMRCIERGRHMEELAASLLWMTCLAAFLQFPTGLPSLGLQKKGIVVYIYIYIIYIYIYIYFQVFSEF
jgi:hypothetical protein